MDELPIYSLGDGAFMAKVLNGIASMDAYTLMGSLGAMFAVVIVAVRYISTSGRDMDWGWILTGSVMFMVLFGYRVDRVVIQEVAPHLGQVAPQTYVVDNVPFGAALGGVLISNAGYYLTTVMEQGFGSSTDRARVTTGAVGNNLKLLAQMRMMGSPVLNDEGGVLEAFRFSLANYIRDCTLPGINAGALNQAAISTAPNVVDAIRFGNRFRSTTIVTPVPGQGMSEAAYTCDEGHAALVALSEGAAGKSVVDAVNEAYGTLMVSGSGGSTAGCRYSAILGGPPCSDAGSGAGAGEGTIVQDTIAAMASFGGPAGIEAQNLVAGNIFNAVRAEAVAGGGISSQDVNSIIALEQAAMQRNTQWAAEENLFVRMLRPAISFFESYFFALFPLMSFVVLLGGFGAKMVMKYLATSIWVALWYPVLTICYAYANTQMEHYLAAISAANLTSSLQLYQISQQAQDALGFASTLAAATPALALSLVYGSAITMTHLATRLQGGDHFNERIATPDAVNPGAVLGVAASQAHGLAVGGYREGMAQPTYSVGQDASASVASSRQEALSARQAVSETLENGIQQIWTAIRQGGETFSTGDAKTDQLVAQFLASHSDQAAKQDQASESRATSRDQSAMTFAEMKIGGSTGGPVSLGANAGFKGTDTSSESAATSNAVTASAVDQVLTNEQLARGLSEAMNWAHAQNAGQFGSVGDSSSIGERFSELVEQARSVTEAWQATEQLSTSVGTSFQIRESELTQTLANRFDDQDMQNAYSRLQGMGLAGAFEANLDDIRDRGLYTSRDQQEMAALVRTLDRSGVSDGASLSATQEAERQAMWAQVMGVGTGRGGFEADIDANRNAGIGGEIRDAQGPMRDVSTSHDQVAGRAESTIAGAQNAADQARLEIDRHVEAAQADPLTSGYTAEQERFIAGAGIEAARERAAVVDRANDAREESKGDRDWRPVNRDEMRRALDPVAYLQIQGHDIVSTDDPSGPKGQFAVARMNRLLSDIPENATWEQAALMREDAVLRLANDKLPIPDSLAEQIREDHARRRESMSDAPTSVHETMPGLAPAKGASLSEDERKLFEADPNGLTAPVTEQTVQRPVWDRHQLELALLTARSAEDFVVNSEFGKFDTRMDSPANQRAGDLLEAARESGENVGEVAARVMVDYLYEGKPVPLVAAQAFDASVREARGY